MSERPAWQWNESRQVGTDYSDPAEVLHYESVMRRLRASDDYSEIAESLRLNREGSLIDMGCGPGLFAVEAARLCRRVHAVDVSEAMLGRARHQAVEAGVTNIEFHRGGLLTYLHDAEPADAAVCMAMLHHLPDFWKGVGLRRLASMLTRKARLFLMDVVFGFEADQHPKHFDTFVKYFEDRAEHEMAREAECHLREEFSTFDWVMAGILQRAGFRILSADNDDMLARYVCEKAP